MAKVSIAGRVVKFLVRGNAAAFEADNAQADVPGLHGRNPAVLFGVQRFNNRGAGQVSVRVIAEIDRAAERRDHAGKNFQCPAGRQCLCQFVLRFGFVFCQFGGKQKFGAKRHGNFVQTRIGVLPLKVSDGFGDFDGIAGGAAENLIHVGQNGGGFGSGAVGDGNDGFCQPPRVVKIIHKSAVAAFEVHDQAVQSGGQFL